MKHNASPATSTKSPRLRIGLKDVSEAEFAEAVRAQWGQQCVSIMLDNDIIAFFKAKAGEQDYQMLINQALHDVMRGDQLEATLRRVIREELHTVQ
ncbi:MAG: BrnA antitoxin family protein [Candidatus Competibacteraceae bacterium]|nr:BrnA antitoxin family protein [Candidatus Competibacteraceae bacterium]